jgi:hypothetical protein
MSDANTVDPATSLGAASTLPSCGEPYPTPDLRQRNREDWPPRVRRRQASAYLAEVHGLEEAPATLAKKACTGGGPIFESFGRIPYYRTESLDSYAKSRLSGPRRSTSDAGKVDRLMFSVERTRPTQRRVDTRSNAVTQNTDKTLGGQEQHQVRLSVIGEALANEAEAAPRPNDRNPARQAHRRRRPRERPSPTGPRNRADWTVEPPTLRPASRNWIQASDAEPTHQFYVTEETEPGRALRQDGASEASDRSPRAGDTQQRAPHPQLRQQEDDADHPRPINDEIPV